MELLKKIAKNTGKPEEELRREFNEGAATFSDKCYEYMRPEETQLFG